MSLAGMTVAHGLLREPPRTDHHNIKKLAEAVPIGDESNQNGGITWFGSQFTGPGNKVIDSNGHYAANKLPVLPNDWVTLEHDVDYHNIDSPTIDNIWNLDKKAIAHSMTTSDPYLGNVATAVGLVTKNVLERTVEGITGSNKAIYPNSTSETHIPWFDKHLSIRKKELRK